MTGDPAVRVRAWLDAPTWLPDAADDLRAVLAELLDYRNAITWETICLSCSRMLDACRAADERAEAAEADLESVGQMLIRAMDGWTEEATPLHDHLGRIRLAAWDPHVDGNAFRELVRAVVGHPLMSREDATAAAASIRAECRRIGIPIADTAEEKVARIRGLHSRYRDVYAVGDNYSCAHCNQITGDVVPWPCATIRALDEETPACPTVA